MRRHSVFFFFCILTCAMPVPRVTASDYIEALIAKADQAHLHEHDYWHLLLHYKRGLFGSQSLIDDPAFFLAETGKTDPRAELHALLRSLAPTHAYSATNHPADRFVARTHWLKEQLKIDPGRVELPATTEFDRAFAALAPQSATLVFPSCYINNPASMFGHALIVFDSADKNRLLATSLSYAGRTDGGFSPTFIIGSFIGTYPGYFSIMPYYDKVEEYGDVGDRDIWEYELDLNDQELERMLMHTWEMQGICSDYYFLNENCAYNLLHLIDAARPSLALRDDFSIWVTPIDTVKAVCEKNLLRAVVYRPSKVTTITYLTNHLLPGERAMALAISGGSADPGTALEHVRGDEQRIMILDLASQHIQYKYTKRILAPEDYRARFLKTLKVRSKINTASGDVYRVPEPCRPDLGHDSSRLSVGIGVRDGALYQTLGWRPVQHGLEDNDSGYDAGAAIEFMDINIRYEPEEHQLSLNKLDILDIYSISARSDFLAPNAWRVTTGLTRRDFDEDDDNLAYQLDLGRGCGYGVGNTGLLYVMLDIALELGPDYADHYLAGAGASAGLVVSPAERWKIWLQGRGLQHLGRTEQFESYTTSIIQDFRITRNNSLAVEVRHFKNDGFSKLEGSISWNHYF